MRVSCTCGHVFRDDASDTSFVAQIVTQQRADPVFEYVADETAALCLGKDLKDWIAGHFGERYPRNAPVATAFYDFIANEMRKNSATVYECPNCGRLLVQTGADMWESYAPEQRPEPHLFKLLTGQGFKKSM